MRESAYTFFGSLCRFNRVRVSKVSRKRKTHGEIYAISAREVESQVEVMEILPSKQQTKLEVKFVCLFGLRARSQAARKKSRSNGSSSSMRKFRPARIPIIVSSRKTLFNRCNESENCGGK